MILIKRLNVCRIYVRNMLSRRQSWLPLSNLNERVFGTTESLPVSLLWLNEKTLLPVENLYETPETLGYDRMAAVVGAYEQFPGKDILVIDAGLALLMNL